MSGYYVISRQLVEEDAVARAERGWDHWCVPVLGSSRCYKCGRAMADDERPTQFGLPLWVSSEVSPNEVMVYRPAPPLTPTKTPR